MQHKYSDVPVSSNMYACVCVPMFVHFATVKLAGEANHGCFPVVKKPGGFPLGRVLSCIERTGLVCTAAVADIKPVPRIVLGWLLVGM